MRETMQDYLLNTNFRKDVFVKGSVKQNKEQHIKAIGEHRLVAMPELHTEIDAFPSPRGPVKANSRIQKKINDFLAKRDNGCGYVQEIIDHCASENIKDSDILRTIAILVNQEKLSPTNSDEIAAKVSAQCKNLNAALDQNVAYSDFNYRASPLTGSGVLVRRIDRTILETLKEGHTTDDDIARHTMAILDAKGKLPYQNDKPVENTGERRAFYLQHVQKFRSERLKIYRNLHLA
jgi:hypothetical protein